MSAFDWGRFQLDAFQIESPVLSPCDQDYVEAGYVEAGYVCGVEAAPISPSGAGRPKKRRVFIEKEDGELLVFDSAAEASLYVTAQKESEKAPEAPKTVLQQKKKPRPIPEPIRVDTEAIRAFYEAMQQQQMLAELEQAKRQKDLETLIGMQIRLNALMAEEDDIETLLLVA